MTNRNITIEFVREESDGQLTWKNVETGVEFTEPKYTEGV